MRIELLVYVGLVLSLLYLVHGLPVPSLDQQVVRACGDLILSSAVHGAVVELPCQLREGQIVFGRSSLPATVSYGVVVPGEHWTPP